MSVGVVIVAAGSGRRMGSEGNKVLLPLEGKTILAHSVDLFAGLEIINEIVVVTREVDLPCVQDMVSHSVKGKRWHVVQGGNERQESVYLGLQALSSATKWAIIHDGARPFLTEEIVRNVFAAAQKHRAAGAAVPVKDTIKRVQNGRILETPPRDKLWAMQTPQIFAYDLILEVHQRAREIGFSATDDCALAEYFGHPVYVAEGAYSNIKITTPEDLPQEAINLVGFGYDVHRLVANRPLILAGIEIPHSTGLLGHSDADVLTHALMDALLGAAGLGDIGELFPDTDPAYKGASSINLLEQVMDKLAKRNLRINNVDITIMAQRPKLSPWKKQMQTKLASVLGLQAERINIKATTGEGLGFVGREEGIGAQAVVSLSVNCC